ncbi:MAG: helix-turn-helix domain-containing protein [Myxococcota bacterium]
MSPAVPSPLRADAARNRRRILDVAREVVAAGDLTPSLNDIARRAGVGVGTVYRHFADHRALVEALAVEHLGALVANARAALEEPDPLVAIERILRSTLAMELSDRSLGAVLASDAAYRERTAAGFAELEHAVAALLARARAAGVIRPDLTPQDLQRLICGIEHAVRSGPDQPAAAARYASVLLAGLCAPPGHRRS